jgi:conjugative relaxase-like TrwC/TraI family protein
MLFITPARNAKEAKDYFTRHIATSDYYLRDAAEFAGEWHGLGAELLGLSGTVDKESYFKLCDNINPKTGEQLTLRTKSERRVLYDFTFDAPKSVTLAYEVGGDERIMNEFRAAVKDTMSEMEGAMMARVRSNGRKEDRASANMVWGEFIHRTTRPVDGVPDPHLHCHGVCFNATWDPEEERWKAGEFSNLVRDRGYYQAAFHSRFAERLRELGYGIERDGKSFRLAGIERATTDKFSRRTEIIEAEAKRLGITDPDVKDQLGRRTREKKNDEELSMSELRQKWKDRLTGEEGQAITGARRGLETTSLEAVQAMDYAVSHCFERGSAIPEKKLLQTALIQSVGAASVADIKGEIARDNVIRRERLGQKWVTTQEVLREEIAMTEFARGGKGRHRRLGGDGKLPDLDAKLSKEQREAALVILNSRDTVTALKGGAGTGKTTMMQETVKAIEAGGKKVFTFAPSADASRGVLREEGFANAQTVERLLVDPKVQAETHGQVIWVDEAGLLSVKDMKRLFDVARDQQARIVLSGDSKQHVGVYRGDALRILEKDSGLRSAQLSEIRRQTNESYRNAVKAISEGDVAGKDGKTRLEAGFEMLDKMGAIVESTGDDRYRQIAADYADITSQRKGKKFKTALVISPTHAEGGKVTQAIREELKAAGRVSNDDRSFLSLRSLNLTVAQRGDAREYRPGTIVQFHQNSKGFRSSERVTVVGGNAGKVDIRRADGSMDTLPLREAKKFQLYTPEEVALATGDKLRLTQNGFARDSRPGLFGKQAKKDVNNGATYEVAGFTRDGHIKLNNGYILSKNYGGLTHGYVVTSHSSQGKTSDVALVALGSESLAAANREQFYVSVSRGREAVKLYTDDKEAMRSAIQTSGARLSATEMMEGVDAIAKPKPGFTGKFLRLQQTWRIYKEKLARLTAWNALNQQKEGRGHERH